MEREKVVMILSGGMDSTTLLYKLINENKDVYVLTFNYSQKHAKELICANEVCRGLGLRDKHKIINIEAIHDLIRNSALTNKNIKIPHGHYNDETMKLTVVPNRNMIFLSLAIAYAVSLNVNKVYYGAHKGDHTIYPDCREEFVNKLNEVSKIANYVPVEVISPFINMSKTDILKEGLALNTPYYLTWSCYEGRLKACGKCGSCVERLEAFKNNNVEDVLVYEVENVI